MVCCEAFGIESIDDAMTVTAQSAGEGALSVVTLLEVDAMRFFIAVWRARVIMRDYLYMMTEGAERRRAMSRLS